MIEDYDAAVAEGKRIVARMDRSPEQMRLGELADSVVTKYGEDRLSKFAKDIGFAACTLKRSRSVFRAWLPEEGKEGAPPISFAVAQALQAHPRRLELVAAKPEMTQREARKIMNQFRKGQTTAGDHQRTEAERWFRALFNLAGKVQCEASIADRQPSPVQQQIYRENTERMLVRELRDAGGALVRLADFLGQFVAEEPQAPQEQPQAAE